jgi:hypothetical protein
VSSALKKEHSSILCRIDGSRAAPGHISDYSPFQQKVAPYFSDYKVHNILRWERKKKLVYLWTI